MPDVVIDVLVVLWFVGVPLVVAIPAFLWAGRASRRPGPSGGSDDGWGNGPRGPDSAPDAPRGGIPLPDAKPARVRIRDHRRLAEHVPARKRRSAREPEPWPARKSPAV